MVELNQVRLLQRFEPVLKFSQGEPFFPFNVEGYVAESSLWKKAPETPAEMVYSETDLTLEKLGKLQLSGSQSVYYLNFISPLNLREMAEVRIQDLREGGRSRMFNPSRSRLARVGYLARMIDVVFSLSLLLRGRVPGDAMTAAMLTYHRMLTKKKAYQYYGRVIEEGGWIVLQYWYFYAFNSWRSGFYGANDHEGDWEMVNIYCYRDDAGAIKPAWVAYANHDYFGDELRRHWEDPELEKVGEHPVAYVGGGSHACYFRQGEYLTQFSLPLLRPLRRFILRLEKVGRRLFRESQETASNDGQPVSQAFTIPFVDYALGDGLCIGAGCEEGWSPPETLDPTPAWAMNYRGLWGYYSQDPFAGEDAPGGPRYNRDGTVRRAWYDPLGWAGMEKVVPPVHHQTMIEQRIEAVRTEITVLKQEITQDQTTFYQMGINLAAMQDAPHLRFEMEQSHAKMTELENDLAEKRRLITVKESLLEAFQCQKAAIEAGELSPLRIHIHRANQPQVIGSLRFNRLAEIWAAVSIGLMMIAMVALFFFARQFLLIGLGGMLLLLLAIEAAFQRRLWALVRGVAIVLALLAFFILFIQYFWYIAGGAILVIGFYMIIENLRELFARR